MIDTHSHLWFDHFDKDRSDVIQRAREAGVHTMIQVGCDEKSSRQAVALAEQYDDMYATVGLHPTDVKSKIQNPKSKFAWMYELLHSSKKVVAIGETGIDYYWEPYDAEAQQESLREQCLIAQEFELPVIVHLRMTKRPQAGADGLNPAESDCLKVLDGVGMQQKKVVFHCFSGSLHMAEEVIKRGWFISFSGVVTYPNAGELREVAKIVPNDLFVVETDCPFLPPQKYRGERNEPAYVVETASVVAQEKGMSLGEVEEATDKNAKELFGV